jgi:hypothetical protein
LGLAVLVLVVGLVTSALQLQATQDTSDRIPVISGLELLVERWNTFRPRVRDSAILHAQFSILFSITELEYHGNPEIRLTRYFSGCKIKGGAFLFHVGEKGAPLVLKFDSWENIQQEEERYKHLVTGCLGLTPGEPRIPPQRRRTIEDKDWGAITYNLIGASQAEAEQLGTFAEYYLSHDNPRDISNALNTVFDAISPWWTGQHRPPEDPDQWRNNTLYGEYDRLTRNQTQMRHGIAEVGCKMQIEKLEKVTATQEYIALDQDGLPQLRNPLNWISEVFETKGLSGWMGEERNRLDSIVHGDFHTGNILISENRHAELRAWLIDFPHTHIGPTIQDIARLEADVKFRLLTDDTLCRLGLGGLHDFEACLLPTPHGLPSWGHLAPAGLSASLRRCAQLKKAEEAVCLLRQKAREFAIGDDARHYYLALVHATMPVLYFGDRTAWQKLYAFISAAMLCEWLA